MARELFKKTIQEWGISAQVTLAMEECGKLVSALNKFFFRNRISVKSLAGEVADVEIACEQIRSIIGDGMVDQEKESKYLRLEERVRVSKKNREGENG